MKKIYCLLALLFCIHAHSQKESETRDQQIYKQLVKEGDSLAEAGNIKESIVSYTKAIALTPDAPDAYYSRGIVNFADSNFNSAVADFTKIIELGTSNSAEIYFLRGLSKMQLKPEATDGCNDLKKAKELNYQFDWEMFKQVCKDL